MDQSRGLERHTDDRSVCAARRQRDQRGRIAIEQVDQCRHRRPADLDQSFDRELARDRVAARELLDRVGLAEDLGFARPTANSLDSVSDRDFVLESINALTLVGVHLSRMAEDLIFYASGEAAFVALGESVTIARVGPGRMPFNW